MRRLRQGNLFLSSTSRNLLCVASFHLTKFSHLCRAQQSEGIITPKDVSDSRSSYNSYLEAELTKASSHSPTISRLQEQWNGIVWSTDKSANHDPKTGIDRDVLEKVGKASIAIPEDFVWIFVNLLCP